MEAARGCKLPGDPGAFLAVSQASLMAGASYLSHKDPSVTVPCTGLCRREEEIPALSGPAEVSLGAEPYRRGPVCHF